MQQHIAEAGELWQHKGVEQRRGKAVFHLQHGQPLGMVVFFRKWRAGFRPSILDGAGQIFSPYIDLTRYTKITINLFIQISGSGSVELAFGFCREAAPNDWIWYRTTGVKSGSNWTGPNISGTYDISGLTGRHRIKQLSINGSGDTVHTFLGNSYFTYLE